MVSVYGGRQNKKQEVKKGQMQVDVIDEYKEGGHLIFIDRYIGVYVRGKTQEAFVKLPAEMRQYCKWSGETPPDERPFRVQVIQEKRSGLQISDADTDVILDSEFPSLTPEEYGRLKEMALKSAKDFLALYLSVPDKNGTVRLPRKTFYGEVLITAREMYDHTKNVNDYILVRSGLRQPMNPIL